jgi:asparagine synthase (glutamine-hydrolysing)
MPGIFGVIDASASGVEGRQRDLVSIVRQMSAAMRYETSYSEALVSCPAVGAWVGRVAVDSVPDAPGAARRGAIVLTTGEASPRLPPVDAPGEQIVRSIAGRCAAFVADPDAKRCFLFNDRYGRERLFVHSDGSRTFFASEAKAILAVVPRTRAFDSTGLAEFLSCGCTLGSRSLFRDIEVLDPGTLMTFDGSAVQRQRIFRPEDLETLEPVSGSEFLEGFADSLRRAVTCGVKHASRTGISLTGGLDSRMVMASLDAPDGSVPCYTFGSMYGTTGDVSVARKVAARCRQPHQVIELGPAFLAGIRGTLEHSVYVADGYIGLSGAAELYLNRQARAIAPIRMTGNWGGELMRGVRAFKATVPKGGFLDPGLENVTTASATAFSRISPNPLTAALFQQMPLQGYGRYAVERSQLVTSTPFLADDAVEWLYRAPAAVRESIESAATVIGRRPDLLSIPTDVGVLGTGPTAIRRAWRRGVVKAEYLTSHGAPDWLANLSARLPASLLETRFLGADKFNHFRFWIRRDLAQFVRDVLVHDQDTGLGTWFDMTRVAAMVDEHIAGRANYTDEIDKLLTVTIAQKTLFKDAAAPVTAGESLVCSL